MTDDNTRSEENPVLFASPNGQLWLLYTAQLAGNQDSAEVRRRISDDDGRTWGTVDTMFRATDCGVFIRQPLVVTARLRSTPSCRSPW
jgi:predicted neuraminidase